MLKEDCQKKPYQIMIFVIKNCSLLTFQIKLSGKNSLWVCKGTN